MRIPVSPPKFIKENIELYKIIRQDKQKTTIGQKRALVNNAKINDFFTK